mmetsp:Transcript_4535/g.13137  ORF Transcript_4535/g.13137 Transcript_4535/m.13137 type:complete len:221 (-) Transcript_4535:507-1169(-)
MASADGPGTHVPKHLALHPILCLGQLLRLSGGLAQPQLAAWGTRLRQRRGHVDAQAPLSLPGQHDMPKRSGEHRADGDDHTPPLWRRCHDLQPDPHPPRPPDLAGLHALARRHRQPLEVACRLEEAGGREAFEIHRRPMGDDHGLCWCRRPFFVGTRPADEEHRRLRLPCAAHHLGAHDLPNNGKAVHLCIAGPAAPAADRSEHSLQLPEDLLRRRQLQR